MNTGGQTLNVYNGMISAVEYKTRAVTNSVDNGANYIDPTGSTNKQLVTASVSEELINQYTYDNEYRLSTVNFGKFNNSSFTYTVNTNACYKEYGTSGALGINYDANGNITALKRNGYIAANILMDNLTYTYTSNTNQLASIIDGVANVTYSGDFDAATSQTFSYNNNGQMSASQAENASGITYFKGGLIKEATLTGGNGTADYWYSDRGQKIKTRFTDNVAHKTKYSWYIDDAGGNSLAIYEYDSTVASPAFKLVDQPIYGSGRIGLYHASASTPFIEYELTDHLGNVRATIKGISTGVCQLVTRTDYYSFGGAEPGRSYNLNTYRYNYQGQEQAVGINWQAFELRMLNSDLGRWDSPDPKGQFYSPYISMGNNPVSGVDPDGGYIYVPQNADYTPDDQISAFWANQADKTSYEHDRFFYDGQYMTGLDIENSKYRDYLKFMCINYDAIFGAEDNPGRGAIDYGTFEMNQYDLEQMQLANGTANVFTEYNLTSNGLGAGTFNNLGDALDKANGIFKDWFETTGKDIPSSEFNHEPLAGPGTGETEKTLGDYGAGYAVGYETSVSASIQGLGLGASGAGVIDNMMQLGGDHGGYFYSYAGGAGGLLLGGAGAGADVSIGRSLFFAVNQTGNLNPETFAGEFDVYSLGAGIHDVEGISVSGALATSKQWNVYQVGASEGLGEGAAANFFMGSSNTTLLNNNVVPTSQRNWLDVLTNISHYGFGY